MSKKQFELLTDAQWILVEPLLPKPVRRKDNRGRPSGARHQPHTDSHVRLDLASAFGAS